MGANGNGAAAPSRELIVYGVARAGTEHLAICLPGVAAMSAVAFQSWLLFGASVAGYLGLVSGRMMRQRFWRETAEELRRMPPHLPDRGRFEVVAARQFVDRIEAARAERGRASELVSPSLPPAFEERATALGELERKALGLVQRLDDLSGYLATKSVPILRADRVRLAHAAENASMKEVRREYEHALAVLQAEIDALDQIALRRDLLTARLERLVGVLELLPPALLQLEFSLDGSSGVDADADVLVGVMEALQRDDQEDPERSAAEPGFKTDECGSQSASPSPLPSLA